MTVTETQPPIEQQLDRTLLTLKDPADETITLVAERSMAPLISLAQEPYPTLEGLIGTLKHRFSRQLAYKPNDTVLLAIKMILIYEKDQRFTNHQVLQFPHPIVEQFGRLPTYNDEESIGEISAASPPPGEQELITIVLDEMAGLYLRKSVNKKKYNREKKQIIYSQAHGHIDDQGKIVPQQTLSSELQKREYSANRSFLANTASLTLQHPDDSTEFIMVRSSRSDNPSRLLKLIQFNILSSVQSKNRPGVIESDKEHPIFRMSLITAQDGSPTRNLFKGFKKPNPVDEARSLSMIKDSVNAIWGEEPYRLVQVKLGDGSTKNFFVEKPLIKNHNLAKTTSDPQIIIDSREWSEETTIREFDLLRKAEVAVNSPLFGNLFQAFSRDISSGEIPTKSAIVDFIRCVNECEKPIYSTASPSEIKLYFALQSVAIALTGNNIEGVAFLDDLSPGLELYYHFYLCELINASISVQCKAGCDRALIMTAMRLAQKQLEESESKIYDLPLDKGCLPEFEDEFNSFCGKFGPPILKVNRGEPLMKGMEKPILRKIFGEKITEHTILGMKLVKGT